VPEFYIPATSSLAERRLRTLKHNDTFALFDHYGDVMSGCAGTRLEILVRRHRNQVAVSLVDRDGPASWR
jgi:hypothetical protein